ncbi:MAG: hypothetical protein ACRDPK_19970, partial [Carbonactinosporaceae bacterium]
PPDRGGADDIHDRGARGTMTLAQATLRDRPGTGIVKPLPRQLFRTHAGEGPVLDAETRWEAMTDGALATPQADHSSPFCNGNSARASR